MNFMKRIFIIISLCFICQSCIEYESEEVTSTTWLYSNMDTGCANKLQLVGLSSKCDFIDNCPDDSECVKGSDNYYYKTVYSCKSSMSCEVDK